MRKFREKTTECPSDLRGFLLEYFFAEDDDDDDVENGGHVSYTLRGNT